MIPAFYFCLEYAHVLTRLEEWRKNLDNSYFITAVHEGLLRTFDCNLHDLTICLFDLTKIGYDGFIDT